MKSARSDLEQIVTKGLLKDIYEADEAFYLYRSIGLYADSINSANFGHLFGRLQRILLNHIILALTRLFEEKDRRYSTLSIPTAITILRERANELKIEQAEGLIGIEMNYALPVPNSSQPEVTRAVGKHFKKSLKRLASITSLRTIRNKLIAHPEAICVEELPLTSPGEVLELLAFAKRFIHTISLTYLSMPYEYTNGAYTLTSDAQRASIALEHLLELAGIRSSFTST